MGRFVIAPLLILGLMYFIPVPVIMKKVFVVQAAMPAMTQTSIVSGPMGPIIGTLLLWLQLQPLQALFSFHCICLYWAVYRLSERMMGLYGPFHFFFG